jgi:eukaryotic-like serine/threonine-protein kinase
MNLEPGLRITENIELRFPIGEGGMGRVWAADHVALGRQVAVKFVSVALSDDAATLQRFAHEAQMLARLQSQYAPQIFDYGTLADGTPFIVMELLSGVSLQTRLENDGPFSLDETGRLVQQLCTVLSSAHALGIIHRDIKPENIILVPDEVGLLTAKVLDFGIAKVMEGGPAGMTQTGMTLGTPSYMSPEQLVSAKAVDARADLWSLAVVAYCSVTGVLPFAGDTFGAVCLAIHSGQLEDPSVLRPDLPPALGDWFRKSLHREITERFSSAAEMAGAFAEIAGASASLPQPLAPVQSRLQPKSQPPLAPVVALSPAHRCEVIAVPESPAAHKKRSRSRVRVAMSAVAAFIVAALAVASWGPGRLLEKSATEKHAEEIGRAVARWSGSVTVRWPIATTEEPRAGAPAVVRTVDPSATRLTVPAEGARGSSGSP